MDFQYVRDTFSGMFSSSASPRVQQLGPVVADIRNCWAELATEFRNIPLTVEDKVEIWRGFIPQQELRLLLWFVGTYQDDTDTLKALWEALPTDAPLMIRVAFVVMDSLRDYFDGMELPPYLMRYLNDDRLRQSEQARTLSLTASICQRRAPDPNAPALEAPALPPPIIPPTPHV